MAPGGAGGEQSGFGKLVPGAEVLGSLNSKRTSNALYLSESHLVARRNAVHVIASDAHDDKHRKPILARLLIRMIE
jgi:tyrosine-protein phosphatase YwqE